MAAAPRGLDRGGPVSRRRGLASRAPLIVALALLGLLAGTLWGSADEPRYEARASVVTAGGRAAPAKLERYAELGASRAVARRAAGMLGNDVPGADLLATVAVAPLPDGGGLSVSASAAAPDVAAAAADAYARALARAGGAELEPGAEAVLPSAPAEDRPTAPWAIAGLLAGLFAGLLLAALLARRDAVAGAPAPAGTGGSAVGAAGGWAEEAPAESGVDAELAGVIPQATAIPGGEPEGQAAGASPAGGSATAEFEAVLGAPLLAVLGDPATILEFPPGGLTVAERERAEIRHLASALGLGGPDAPRVAALIPASGEIRTAAPAVALALAGAELRLRTLLVEADLGHPSLAAALGVSGEPGLLEHLRGEAAPREVLRGLSGSLDPAHRARFACVPAGGGASAADAGRLASGERIAALLSRLGRAYELVIVTGPPLGDGTGAAGLARRVQAVVAVSDERELLRGGAADVALRLSGAPLRGGILTTGSGPG